MDTYTYFLAGLALYICKRCYSPGVRQRQAMSEYKNAKEAFVSDNLGQSLISINLTSLTALVSLLSFVETLLIHALYAVIVSLIYLCDTTSATLSIRRLCDNRASPPPGRDSLRNIPGRVQSDPIGSLMVNLSSTAN